MTIVYSYVSAGHISFAIEGNGRLERAGVKMLMVYTLCASWPYLFCQRKAMAGEKTRGLQPGILADWALECSKQRGTGGKGRDGILMPMAYGCKRALSVFD
eukprot:1151606-Pelagomonas_calceolata.AAC.1